MDEKITPNCRYGHGDLIEIADIEENLWGLASPKNGPFSMFVGKLFVCGKCGYTEFFDNDPAATERHYSAK